MVSAFADISPTWLLAALIFGYALGAIPFGMIVTRLAGLGDIRAIGSGNIGATNVLRTGKKGLAALTLIGDFGKGAVAVLAASQWGDALGLVAGLGAFLGHLFPVWLKFKGGKGVATALGMMLALAPWTGLAACAVWLVMAFSLRYSSLAALVALFSTPFSAYIIYDDVRLSCACAMIAALVFYTHRANIGRLLKGEEPKIGQKKGHK
jgi:glycerol-3-phosphate acyltransferase PlsY